MDFQEEVYVWMMQLKTCPFIKAWYAFNAYHK